PLLPAVRSARSWSSPSPGIRQSCCQATISAPPAASLSTNPSTTATYTLSLHDALPISLDRHQHVHALAAAGARHALQAERLQRLDRKSTRLNSSHGSISYAVFCLKKKSKMLVVGGDADPPIEAGDGGGVCGAELGADRG